MCVFENIRYLRNIADNSVTLCDEIIDATDSVLANIKSNVSINFDEKKI